MDPILTLPNPMAPLTTASFSNIIDGQRCDNGVIHQGQDPRSKSLLWPVPSATAQDLDKAVEAAQAAFPSWSATPWERRQDVLRTLAVALRADKHFFSVVVSKETGKTTLMGDLEVDHSIDFLEFNASQTMPDSVVHEEQGMKIIATYKPLGIVGAICPWNFPLVLAMAKIAASLVTGNCIIVKPSPFTPYSILKFAELAISIVPKGVLQALHGGADLGPLMTTHPGIQKITFTGSTATGKRIMAAGSQTLKRMTLELGGNDAAIVCSDANIDIVAPQVAAGCLFNAGQMCIATKRVYVHRDIYKQFRDRLIEEVNLLAGSTDPGTPSVYGPMQNNMQYSVVQDIIEDCRVRGFNFSLGGKPLAREDSMFIPPTIIENPSDDSRVVQEEQFGPIIPLLSWESEDEVIRRVNGTDCGLGASVFSSDVSRADGIGRQLEVGSVWLNSFSKPHPAGYFSGHKQSGIGGEWGKQGLLAYCASQSIHVYQ